MKSLGLVLRLFLRSSRIQRKRAFPTIASIAWGTLALLMLLSFGEGMRASIATANVGMGENIVVLWPGESSLPYKGMPIGRPIRPRVDDVEALRARAVESETVLGELRSWRASLTHGRKTVNSRITGAYPDYGEMRNHIARVARSLSNHEFFTRLGRRLIKALEALTEDGFVFRVDMRLRPWGTSGALAAGFDAMEGYYEEQGRPWERYAMIKARICGGDAKAGEELLQRLRPFVYRRYIDYSAFGSLRELKGMIQREVQRKGMDQNVKLGSGGIREIEFIAQAFQLIRGGLDPRLQQRALLPVLDTLAELAIIAPAVRDDLGVV